MLDLALLGLLKERPMHGYDLRKRLREDYGLLSNLSFGSLYPALGRLEAAGAVTALSTGEDTEAETPIPLTGSLGGERAAHLARRATAKAAAALGGRGTRSRKVYEITDVGEQLFERLLEAPDERGEDPRAFSLRLAFARHLTPAARLRLLERRRVQLFERLGRADRQADSPRRPLDAYERSVAEHSRELAARELSWIDDLIAMERSGGATRPSDVPPAEQKDQSEVQLSPAGNRPGETGPLSD